MTAVTRRKVSPIVGWAPGSGQNRYVVTRLTPKATRMGLEIGDILERISGAALNSRRPQPGPLVADVLPLADEGVLAPLRKEA